MASYETWLRRRLSEVYEANSLLQNRELNELRLIVFSDLHKGQKDGADDFQQCETVYLAALDHYWEAGFELFLLGDVEELWECRPVHVITTYGNILEREKAFAEAQNPARYMRFVGNHDDLWYEADEVEKHLGRFLGQSKVQEGLRLKVRDQGQDLGELFLIHGHQGTLDSDRYRKFSAWVIRAIWRPIQRFFRFKSTTPSNNFELKRHHELAMYEWAASGSGRVLIAGHTHHPVWEGLSFQQALELSLESQGLNVSLERSWIAEEIGGRIDLPGEKPFYFNTGCCSFGDGSITGIEIASGEIRLVRWDDPTQPRRSALFTASLANVLRAVAPTS